MSKLIFLGRPEPWVRWWRDETLVDSSDTIAGYPNVKKNQLVISRLSREHLNSVFTCQASNNNISQPVSTSLTVEIHCKFDKYYNILSST